MIPSVPIKKRRRIVVNLLTSCDNEAAISLAVQLAGHFGLDLSAIFTEEDRLHDLAGFSFAKAQQVSAPQPNKITPREMASAIHHQVELCRKILLEAAEQADLKWTFTVQRGTLLGSLKSAQQYDYVVLPRIHLRGDPASMLINLRIAETFSKIIFIAAEGANWLQNRPVMLLLDNAELDAPLVKVAERFAISTGVPLHILLIGADNDEGFVRQLQFILDKERRFDFLQIPASNVDLLISMVATFQASLVIASLSNRVIEDDAIAQRLLNTVKSPFMLMQNEELLSP